MASCSALVMPRSQPGCEHTAGAVEHVLLPGNGDDLDATSGLAELLPKPPVGSFPGMQLGMGTHPGGDVGENRPVLLDGHGPLYSQDSQSSPDTWAR